MRFLRRTFGWLICDYYGHRDPVRFSCCCGDASCMKTWLRESMWPLYITFGVYVALFVNLVVLAVRSTA